MIFLPLLIYVKSILFHDFSTSLNLREINFRDSRSAILMHFEALDFDFYEFKLF